MVIGLSAASYKGSLSPAYTRWTPAYQLGIRFQKRRILNGMISVSFGKVIGESRTYKVPSGPDPQIVPVNRFETSFIGLQYDLQILLFQYKGLRFFASQGLGILRFSPKDWDGNDLTSRDRTRAKGETYSTLSFMFPTQVGLMYTFSNGMGLSCTAGWVNTTTNYLDNMDKLATSNQGDNMAMYKMQFLFPIRR